MQSFFTNAQDFTIAGGSFSNNVHYHNDEKEVRVQRGIELLYQNTATGASHESEQRFPPPNCHPGTRIRILAILRHWIREEAKNISVFWLYGPAGVGKSAIAQNLCETFVQAHQSPTSSQSRSGQLAASFFFARADPHRNNIRRFFTTVAYQLATSRNLSPLLRESIGEAVMAKHDLVHAALELQFHKLIFEPCTALSCDKWKYLPKLIIIDGLDECLDIPSQERLLRIIGEAKKSSSFPLEFLICSRPEPRIKNAFNDQLFHSIFDCLEVGDSLESSEDIAMYLRDGFNRIHDSHSHIPSLWPSEDVIQQLTQRACGQFIYAATVLKYVGDYCAFPPEQLEIILKITVPEDFDSPYPDLDLLYTQILSTCPQKDLLLDFLGCLVMPHDVFHKSCYQLMVHGKTLECLASILFLSVGKVRMLLFGLHSVLDIPDKGDEYNYEIRILHASFIDFLTDPKRSGSYFVQKGMHHELMARYLLKRIIHTINFTEHPDRMNDYAWGFWHWHFFRVTSPTQDFLSLLGILDVYEFVNKAMRRSITSGTQDGDNSFLGILYALQRSLMTLEGIAFWARCFGAMNLVEKYSALKLGFQVQYSLLLDSELDTAAQEKLSQLTEVFKFILSIHGKVGEDPPPDQISVEDERESFIQYYCDEPFIWSYCMQSFQLVYLSRDFIWELTSCLLDYRGDVREVWNSYLHYGPIKVVAPLSSPRSKVTTLNASNHDIPQSRKLTASIKPSSNELISIDLEECHQRLRVECLRILRKSWKYDQHVIAFARQLLWPKERFFAFSMESEEAIVFLERNLSWLKTADDTRKAIARIKEFPKSMPRDRMIEHLGQKLNELEQQMKHGPPRKPLNRILYHLKHFVREK